MTKPVTARCPAFGFSACVLALALVPGCKHATAPVAPERLVGVWHKVESGDTAESIAKRYGADAAAIVELNDLARDGSMPGKEEVFVPKEGGEPPGTGATPAAAAVPSVSASSGRCGGSQGVCLAWPVKGVVSSAFGSRGSAQHDGVDIPAAAGTTIRAAAAGKVIYSGDAIKGYGNLVIIRHDGGIITVYAHNAENLVREGDTVTQGQAVARVGHTGSAETDHVHFEVRVEERPRDPLLYLTPEQ